MTHFPIPSVFTAAMLLAWQAVPVSAQDQPLPPDQQTLQQQAPPAQPMSPEQLDNLVAPIALYPDSLLSQVMVASTYPLEIVEASQWLGQNGSLPGQSRIGAAQQQNWDPSVQALVAFPDVVKRLAQDVRWTTDLGNAFLAQQPDVMDAVQRMRSRAQQAGRLTSTPQQLVNVDNQSGQPVIEIEPANPQVVYVPTYNPAYIWGPPAYGYYPPLYYPGVGFGFGFGGGIQIGAFFGGFGGGWAGWGWGPSWGNRTIIVNNNFFHRYGFNDYHGGGFGGGYAGGASVWVHDPGHRVGVPYANSEVSNRFRSGGSGGQQQGFGRQQSFAGQQNGAQQNFGRQQSFSSPQNNGQTFGRQQNSGSPQTAGAQNNNQNFGRQQNSAGAPQGVRQAPQPQAAPAQRFGSPQFEQRNSGGGRSAFSGVQDGGRARSESDHGFSSMGQQRSAAPAARSAPAPASHGGGGESRGRR